MNLNNLIRKVRIHARDFNESIFREEDIIVFINEGIDRTIQIIPQFQNIAYLENKEDTVNIMPREYVHLLSNYAVARLFSQDERHYEATTFMNEFEGKMDEMKDKIDSGEIELVDDETGENIVSDTATDYVTDNYFFKNGTSLVDEGVEGVE